MKYVFTPLGSSGYFVDELAFYDKRTVLEEQEVQARWDARKQRARLKNEMPTLGKNKERKM